MSLLKLRGVPFILIEDDKDKNTLPLLLELTENSNIPSQMFCYEQPLSLWKNIFRNALNYKFYDEFDPEKCEMYFKQKTNIIIDSVNIMALLLGWNQCLKYLKIINSNSNVVQLIVILHRDCLSITSKLQSQLNHIANAIISYDSDGTKIQLQIKKSGKIFKSKEHLTYDNKTRCLKVTPVVENKEVDQENAAYPDPGTLSTFKIEVAQIEQMEKNKLQLPYMSKIKYGDSKIYYEPDAVDDWDEEDPDDDLNI